MAEFKYGLDYYSHYIGMTKDSKLRPIRKKFGSAGVDVWLAVLDLIYSDKGYYIPYGNENEIDNVTWSVSDYVKGKYAPDVAAVEEIIESLVACGLFSGDLFKLGILSSKRIQLQYYASTVERKAVEVIPEYWIVSLDEMKKLSERSSILRFFSNQPNIGDKQPIGEDNRPNTEQSKVNKSKAKKSELSADAPAASPLAPVVKEQLIEMYGSENVADYERRFDNWRAKKGGNIRADKYRTIAEWLKQDGVTKPCGNSSFVMEKVMDNIRRGYRDGKERLMPPAPEDNKEV
ncbi:MAG: DUF4373 domain-containing protein [Oscillospiraceae bacterium]|nr:DUF4373 domain-containing protein [Oscillospiraceae bacterium]